MLAISALVSAPNRVITPATIQTPSTNSGEPNCAAITAGFLKMPEPITPPTTIMTVVKRPRAGSRPEGRFGATGEFMQNLKLQTSNSREAPKPKLQSGGRSCLGVWSLEFLWSLVVD